MNWLELSGFGILCILFIYIAVRIGAAAWFRSKNEYEQRK